MISLFPFKFCYTYYLIQIFVIPSKKISDSHGNVEEEREEELVVNGHGYELGLVELRGRLSHHDAEPDAPRQKHHLHWGRREGKLTIISQGIRGLLFRFRGKVDAKIIFI